MSTLLFMIIALPIRLGLQLVRYVYTKTIGNLANYLPAPAAPCTVFKDSSLITFNGSYSEAITEAKQNLQYLMVLIHSPYHDDSPIDLISDPEFMRLAQRPSILIWTGIADNRECLKVSSNMGVTCYPFLAFIGLRGSQMKVFHRFQGLTPANEVVGIISDIMAQVDPTLISVKSDRESMVAGRSIREQQDEAYQLSLYTDRRKAQKIKEDGKLKAQEEEQAEHTRISEVNNLKVSFNLTKKRKGRKNDLLMNLIPEPEPTCLSSKINIRTSSGSRLIRTFACDAKLQLLYDFIDASTEVLDDFVVVNTYPRKVLERHMTFEEARLVPNGTVLVEDAGQV